MNASVIIPAYNAASTVESAIRSVLDQMLAVREVIVVDDGSRDDTAVRVESFGPPVRCIRQANAGVAAARNCGIREATGDWIAFLDADDQWLPNRLADQAAILAAHSDLVWAAGAYEIWRGDERVGESSRPRSDEILQDGQVIRDVYEALAAGWSIWTGTVLVRRDVLLNVGLMDEGLKRGEDINLWVRIGRQHPSLAYAEDSIARYCVAREGSLTGTAGAVADETRITNLALIEGLSNGLPDLRRHHLREFLHRHAKTGAICALRGGWTNYSRKFIQFSDTFHIGRIPVWVRLCSLIPQPVARWLIGTGKCLFLTAAKRMLKKRV